MKYSAIQSFIAAFEGNESEAYARANLDLFGLQVDALHGGPTAKTLGGRKIASIEIRRSAALSSSSCLGALDVLREK